MATRPQIDIDAEAFEAKQLAELDKKGGAGAELVAAVRLARQGRTEAGLDCEYTEMGEAKFNVQQGLKAGACTRRCCSNTHFAGQNHTAARPIAENGLVDDWSPDRRSAQSIWLGKQYELYY